MLFSHILWLKCLISLNNLTNEYIHTQTTIFTHATYKKNQIKEKLCHDTSVIQITVPRKYAISAHTCPVPTWPQYTTLAPMQVRSSLAAVNSSSAPPTIKVSLPELAAPTPGNGKSCLRTMNHVQACGDGWYMGIFWKFHRLKCGEQNGNIWIS